MSNTVGTVLRGVAMGVAEAIPGVSGGTIAFITNIYERLITAIKSIDGEAIRLLTSMEIGELWKKVDGAFLLKLVLGMVLGIGISVFTITELLAVYPEYLWAFFFGLILASGLYIARQNESWGVASIAALVMGLLIAVFISRLTPAGGSESLIYTFFCGVIAISALVLPGVSGSFMLLILGMYTTVIGAVRGLLESPNGSDFSLLLVFGLGCLLGLAVFSRVISWAYAKYKSILLALMTGFVLGSLYKIWPWRNPVQVMTETGDIVQVPDSWRLPDLAEMKILSEKLVGPSDYFLSDPSTIIVIACAALGASVVLLMSRLKV